MKPGRDPLVRSGHWHVDWRIVADLPEDTIVGTRFLINAVFTAVALGALLYAGWLLSLNLTMRHQIRESDQRMKDNQAEDREIKRMQQEYAVEAEKIDQAYALVRPRLYVSGFVNSIGRTRPEQMGIDIIEWNEAGIVIRGSLQEKSELASRLLGAYVEQLRRDEQIGPLFRDIHLTDLDRGTTGETLKFEIFFALKPAKS